MLSLMEIKVEVEAFKEKQLTSCGIKINVSFIFGVHN